MNEKKDVAPKHDSKPSLDERAAKATIRSLPFTVAMLIIAVVALAVASFQLRVMVTSLAYDADRIALFSKLISSVLVPIEDELHQLQLNAGVYNGMGAFVRRIDATHGDEVLVQFYFRNISDFKMDSIGARVALPNGLEFVSGSTMLFNRTNPTGMNIDDGITVDGLTLGGYNPFDGQGRGSGSVSFRVRVSEDESLFVPGVNTFNIVVSIGGYVDGALATRTRVAYTAIDVFYTYA